MTTPLTPDSIHAWLRETDHARLKALWGAADAARRQAVGDAVFLRALVEISNRCVRNCAYCGIRARNRNLQRYRMTTGEILACARQARDLGFGTLVLQSGEDPGLSSRWVSDLIRAVKAETGMAVTLSLGDRDDEAYGLWRQAGADRYLLRFETANPRLYERVHPDAPDLQTRLGRLRWLRELGYEVGTGFLVGLPGQTYADLAADLVQLASLSPDMIGVGPFLAHPDTPLGHLLPADMPEDQVPGTSLMTCKAVALARLLCPGANIPSTTALAVSDPAAGRSDGLMRGANVVMPNFTPLRYRHLYEIYPGKATLIAEAGEQLTRLKRQLAALERPIGSGRGDSPAYGARNSAGLPRSQS